MAKFFGYSASFVLAGLLALVLWDAIGMSDALEEGPKRPAPATREQLESLCVAGNANACKLYQVRYEQRCIL